jgi:hypothetical protein
MTEQVIWSQAYNRPMTHVSLQTTLPMTLRQIAVKLSGTAEQKLAKITANQQT